MVFTKNRGFVLRHCTVYGWKAYQLTSLQVPASLKRMRESSQTEVQLPCQALWHYTSSLLLLLCNGATDHTSATTAFNLLLDSIAFFQTVIEHLYFYPLFSQIACLALDIVILVYK